MLVREGKTKSYMRTYVSNKSYGTFIQATITQKKAGSSVILPAKMIFLLLCCFFMYIFSSGKETIFLHNAFSLCVTEELLQDAKKKNRSK